MMAARAASGQGGVARRGPGLVEPGLVPIDGRQNPRTEGNPNWAAVLTWLVPGAGHLYLGRPVFALAAFA
jgi:hypothetical protein